MEIEDLVEWLNNYLEVEKFQDICVNGLVIEGKEDVRRILFGVSPTLSLIKYACENEFDLIITHHSLLLKNNLIISKDLKEKLKMLLDNDISLYSVHLPLDFHEEVGNWKYVLDLLKENVKSFSKSNFLCYIVLNGGMKLSEIVDKLSRVINVYEFGSNLVKSIVFCPGAGSGEILKFLSKKRVDLVITGEISLHLYERCKDLEIDVVEMGHYFSEVYGLKLLMKKVKENFNLDCAFFEESLLK